MERAFGQLGQPGEVTFPTDQRPEDGPARCPDHVRGDRAQLDVGRLQGFLDPIGPGGPLLQQDGPMAREIPEFVDRRRLDEAGPQQPMLQQPGQPFAIAHVGLRP